MWPYLLAYMKKNDVSYSQSHLRFSDYLQGSLQLSFLDWYELFWSDKYDFLSSNSHWDKNKQFWKTLLESESIRDWDRLLYPWTTGCLLNTNRKTLTNLQAAQVWEIIGALLMNEEADIQNCRQERESALCFTDYFFFFTRVLGACLEEGMF